MEVKFIRYIYENGIEKNKVTGIKVYVEFRYTPSFKLSLYRDGSISVGWEVPVDEEELPSTLFTSLDQLTELKEKLLKVGYEYFGKGWPDP